jgi:hypothetical protein
VSLDGGALGEALLDEGRLGSRGKIGRDGGEGGLVDDGEEEEEGEVGHPAGDGLGGGRRRKGGGCVGWETHDTGWEG